MSAPSIWLSEVSYFQHNGLSTPSILLPIVAYFQHTGLPAPSVWISGVAYFQQIGLFAPITWLSGLLCATHMQRNTYRDGSRAASTSKMECFAIIVNSFQRWTIVTKRSTLDVAAALGQPMI